MAESKDRTDRTIHPASADHGGQSPFRCGQAVSQGQVIGYVGATGRVTGPHLHYEQQDSPSPVAGEGDPAAAITSRNSC